jgi:5-methyltetrahydrofolate--homocysteine methyltransferase
MNEHVLMGQIANHIVKGKFETHMPPKTISEKVSTDLSDLIQLSMDKKVPPPLVFADALDKAMDDTIKKYKAGEFLLPDLIIRAAYTGKSREILADFVGDAESLTKGTVVLATIDGKDYTHWDEMVEIILKGLGYKIINLGDESSASDILRFVDKKMPDILWLNIPSTSIPEFNVKPSTTLESEIKQVTDNISAAGLRDKISIMVGGIDGICSNLPPVKELRADFCCGNALQTISYLRKLAFSAN